MTKNTLKIHIQINNHIQAHINTHEKLIKIILEKNGRVQRYSVDDTHWVVWCITEARN